MAQIVGVNQNIEVDVTGAGSSYKNLVCLRNSSVEGTNSVSEEETNCGKLTSVANPGFTFSADAVCETAPTISQVSYKDLLTAFAASTLVAVRFQNPVVTGSSVGAAYYHQALCYITGLTLNQDAAGGAYINFTVTFQSTGVIDVTV